MKTLSELIMKKKLIAAACAALPLFLLCACGGTSVVPVSAYWYQDASTANNLIGRSERLEYEVKFTPAEKTGDRTLSYENGSFVTELTATTLDKETVYLFTTKLEISGKYTVNGTTGEAFSDSVSSSVYFKSAEGKLQPLKSEKTVHSTSPNKSYTSVADCSTLYEYTQTIVYEKNASSAIMSYNQTLPESKTSETKIQIGNATNFYDNEQMLFVLRGVELNSAVTLKTINPLYRKVDAVRSYSVLSLQEKEYELTIGEETAKREIDAYRFSFGYSSSFPGTPYTLEYAKTVDKYANTYRNALLRMSVPVLYNLGTLEYKLVKAQFAN